MAQDASPAFPAEEGQASKKLIAVEKAAAALIAKIEHAGSNMAEREIEDLRRALRGAEQRNATDDPPAFEVTDLAGKSFRIWADGRTEGFEDMQPRIVFNRIPALLAKARGEWPSKE